MSKLVVGAVLALSLVIAAPAVAQTRAEQADKAAIRKLEDDYAEAWTKRDAQILVQSSTDDTDIVIILRIFNRQDLPNFYSRFLDPPPASKRKAFQDYLEKLLGSPVFRFARRKIMDTTVELLGPGTAPVATAYNIDGPRSGHPLWAGHTLRKVEKRGNQWRTTSFEEVMYSVPGN